MKTASTELKTAINTPLRRPTFLRRSATAAGLAGIMFLTAACGSSDGASSAAGPADVDPANGTGTVEMMAWQGYEGEGLLDDWYAERQITPKNSPITSDQEILTKLKAGGVGRYDLASPNAGYVPTLAKAGVIQPIDLDKIPNAAGYLSSIEDAAKDVLFIDGKWYGIPFMWGLESMLYNADKIDEPTSWNVMWDPALKGKVALVGPMHMALQSFTKMLGYEPKTLTPEQLAEIEEQMTQLIAEQARIVTDDPNQALTALAAGDVHVVASGMWTGYTKYAPEGDTVAYTIPEEGASIYIDAWVTPADAPNLDAAYAFLNETLDPDFQAEFANGHGLGATIEAALDGVSEENRALFPYDAEIGSPSMPVTVLPVDDQDGKYTSYQEWSTVWERIKSSAL